MATNGHRREWDPLPGAGKRGSGARGKTAEVSAHEMPGGSNMRRRLRETAIFARWATRLQTLRTHWGLRSEPTDISSAADEGGKIQGGNQRVGEDEKDSAA